LKLVLYLEQSSLEELWLGAWRASRVWTESLNEAGYQAIWLEALEEVRYGWRYWTRSDMAGGLEEPWHLAKEVALEVGWPGAGLENMPPPHPHVMVNLGMWLSLEGLG